MQEQNINIMGVLNITHDSFFDGGNFLDLSKSKDRVRNMVYEGVDILDIGGESTRPNTPFHTTKAHLINIPEEQELARILPIVAYIEEYFPHLKISIDTRSFKVIEKMLEHKIFMINHITSEIDPRIAKLMARRKDVKICICHMHGTPLTMQEGPFIEGDIVSYLNDWFEKQINILLNAGVFSQQIYLDPGIGFGKRKPDQDLEIINGLPQIKKMGYPIIIGLSRKSFMGKILGKTASELLPATIAMNAIALKNGADILRVHDVKEAKDLAMLWSALQQTKKGSYVHCA